MPRPKLDEFEYINRYYRLNLKPGTPVVSTTLDGVRRHGKVVKTEPRGGAHIMIRFNGLAKLDGPFHPTWRLEYFCA